MFGVENCFHLLLNFISLYLYACLSYFPYNINSTVVPKAKILHHWKRQMKTCNSKRFC